MRLSELIRAHQSSSELIRAHQSSSELIRAHQSSSELIRAMGEAIRAHQRGHQRSLRLQSEVIRGPHPKPSPASAH